jgi:hypothetical protein
MMIPAGLILIGRSDLFHRIAAVLLLSPLGYLMFLMPNPPIHPTVFLVVASLLIAIRAFRPAYNATSATWGRRPEYFEPVPLRSS